MATVDFINRTSSTWIIAIYQVPTPSEFTDSVSWKQTRVPASGQSGVTWETTYNVALGDYREEDGARFYRASQILPAALGTQWMIMFADGTQRLFPDGDAPSPDQIIIKNRSGSLANPGIGMDGSAAFYVPDVRSDVNFAFSVPPAPIYYAALFQNIELGEVIGSNVDVGPFELTFSEGADKVTLTAEEADGSIEVTLTYSTQPSLTLRSANRLNPAPGPRRWR